MTQFEGPQEASAPPTAGATTDATDGTNTTAAPTAPAATPTTEARPAPMPGPRAAPASPVAAALAELDTLPQRELAEHAETYQRIHAELQSALATIDNA